MNRKRKTIPAMLIAAAHEADEPQVTRNQNAPAQKPLPILSAALTGVTGFALVLALSHAINAEAAMRLMKNSPAAIYKGESVGQKNT